MDDAQRKRKQKSIGDDAGSGVRFNGRNLDKVIPIRISADKWEQIKKETDTLGVGSTTLVRMWILDGLRRHLNGLKSWDFDGEEEKMSAVKTELKGPQW